MGEQEGQPGIVHVRLQLHRRREAAQQRGHRGPGQVHETKTVLLPGEFQHPGAFNGPGLAFQPQRQVAAVRIQQAQGQRNVEGVFFRLARGRGAGLAHGEGVTARGGVIVPVHVQHRRTGLAVPALELAQVHPVGVGHGLHEIVGGHRLAVMAAEIQVQALAEALAPHQGVDHAHHLRPLLVHGGGIEIVHLHVGLGPHRVGHGTGVFRELAAAQLAHVVDALDRPRAHVGAELLVAEHGQPLFQAELEPVATGDPVAGPVVKILVGDDPLDARVVRVGGGLRPGQDTGGVEQVQALVLHGPHVEMAHGHDHVDIQIVLQAEALLVPAHGLFQGGHGVGALVPVPGLHVEPQVHLPARGGGVAVLQADQVPRHQGEQVAGFLVGIVPAHPVAAAGGLALRHQVSVGQEHRKGRLVRLDGGDEGGHHVRPVQIVCDAAKAFGLALGTVHALGSIQALQGGVVLGPQAGLHLQLEAARHPGNGQGFLVPPVALRRQRLAVQGQGDQLQRLTVQHQRPAGFAVGGVGPEADTGPDPGVVLPQIEMEFDGLHQIIGRRVVLETEGARRVFAHGGLPLAKVSGAGWPTSATGSRDWPGNRPRRSGPPPSGSGAPPPDPPEGYNRCAGWAGHGGNWRPIPRAG